MAPTAALSAQQPRLKRIVKLGGAAITVKQQLETLDAAALAATAQQLQAALAGDAPGEGTVLVHGAGSFGHFQASQAGVARGGLHQAQVRQGFVQTRLSVTRLNHMVVSALAAAGVAACALSPCGHWVTSDRRVAADGCASVAALLQAGFVPVLHGDAVLDDRLGCTILSGDVIVRHLAEVLRPDFVVFLTDVDGIFDRPPSEAGARLLTTITVTTGGAWPSGARQPRMTCDQHDTTGGIATKVEEAVAIAKLGVTVLIAKAGTSHAAAACRLGPAVQQVTDMAASQPWTGTLVVPEAGHAC